MLHKHGFLEEKVIERENYTTEILLLGTGAINAHERLRSTAIHAEMVVKVRDRVDFLLCILAMTIWSKEAR